MRRLKKTLGAFVLLAALGACGRGGGLTTGDGAAFTLRIHTAGGFVPPGADQVSVPEFTLTGDGRAVTGGPQIEIYPGPALPNVLQRTVRADGVAAIEAEARAAGLFGPDRHYGHDGIADAGTTFFIVESGGERHQISAYALGMEAAPGPATSSQDTEERAKLQRFREKVGDLGSWLPDGSLGDEEPYEITALRVVSRPGGDNPDDGVEASEKDWPASPLRTFGEATGEARCGVVTGDDLGKVLPLAREANQITLWRSEGATYSLQFRPQLPDEDGCEVPQQPQG